MASVYLMQDKLEAAERLLEELLDEEEARANPDPQQILLTLQQLSSLYLEAGRHEERIGTDARMAELLEELKADGTIGAPRSN